jgi:succinate dehydrogenase/fumarate reductase-like Fe-S protein
MGYGVNCNYFLYGIPHHDLLRLIMYHDGYENDSLAKESLQMMTRENIQHCSECPSCSVVCRRGLDIQAQIQLTQELIVRLPAAGREFEV